MAQLYAYCVRCLNAFWKFLCTIVLNLLSSAIFCRDLVYENFIRLPSNAITPFTLFVLPQLCHYCLSVVIL